MPWFDMRRQAGGDRRVRLVVDGELDFETAPALEDELSQLKRERADVLLDLTGVSFMDSAGARVLWEAASDAARGGWTLSATPPLGEARLLVEFSGLSSRLPLVE